jgi:putative ABC transport system permease protein
MRRARQQGIVIALRSKQDRIADESAHRSRVLRRDLAPLAWLGLRSRPIRTLLSATGVALGIATMIAVLGISSSSRAQLLAQIDTLGTNLLTVTPGQSFSGQGVTLPVSAPAMIRRIGPVLGASGIGEVNANVYRNDRISPANTNAVTVYTVQPGLLTTLQATLAHGEFLNRAAINFPAVVLGAAAAAALGIDDVNHAQVWLGHRWFTVVGVLRPIGLAPELDRSALIGLPIARRAFGATAAPVEIYVRAQPVSVGAVRDVLPATVYPAAPQDVAVANPSDALTARADAAAAFESLFLALGAVALVISGVGITNIMVIAVLERRNEIGLRRALGATRIHIGAQFFAESALLALVGGVAGSTLGVLSTHAYATARGWDTTIPPTALAGALTVAVIVGTVAGAYPALKAARLTPLEALRSR